MKNDCIDVDEIVDAVSDETPAIAIAGNASTVDASGTINGTTISHLEESSISDIKDEKFNYLKNPPLAFKNLN